MIRCAAYPGLSGPRRARRGAAALLAVLLLTGLLSALMVSWQVSRAEERLRGQARHLAEVVAAEGYALHHWLHEARNGSGFNAPAEGTARVLTTTGSNPEAARLADHSATTPWRRSSTDSHRVILPRGWEIGHLVGRATGADLPDGIVVLRPSDDMVNAPGWERMDRALDVLLGGGSDAADTLAAAALSDFDAARDRAVPASPLSRLDGTAVLRDRHAGTAQPVMQTDIVLRGGDLLGAKRIEAEYGLIPRITGTCAGPTALCATRVTSDRLDVTGATSFAGLSLQSLNRAGDLAGITRLGAGTVAVTGSLTTPELTACKDPSADLCGGGDLDLEDATGTPDWTRAAIFGDVTIRDGNRITGVTRTTAQTGLFGSITGGPVLDVGDCLRSVTPFVYGAGCP